MLTLSLLNNILINICFSLNLKPGNSFQSPDSLTLLMRFYA